MENIANIFMKRLREQHDLELISGSIHPDSLTLCFTSLDPKSIEKSWEIHISRQNSWYQAWIKVRSTGMYTWWYKTLVTPEQVQTFTREVAQRFISEHISRKYFL